MLGQPGLGGRLCQPGWDWGERSRRTQPPGGPPHPHLRPTACPRGASGFHHVPQQSGCDIMRQAGVSGVTSRGPDVWKSPNQNDPTDELDTGFSKRAPSITQRQEQERPGPLDDRVPRTATLRGPGTAWGPRGTPSPRLLEAHPSWGRADITPADVSGAAWSQPHALDKEQCRAEHQTQSYPVLVLARLPPSG